MQEQKISLLDEADALDGTELIVVVQGGVTKKSTAQEVADLPKTGGATGTFLSADDPAKTITVTNGIITDIS